MIYLRLIWSYLKIGLFGFGGGYAMLSLIEREIVGNGWITEKMFTDIVAISQMTPGPIGINSATYIGYAAPLRAGFTGIWVGNPRFGALHACSCRSLVSFGGLHQPIHDAPSRESDHPWHFQGATACCRGTHRLSRPSADERRELRPHRVRHHFSVAISAAALATVLFTKIHPIWVIVAAGCVGLLTLAF